MLGSAKGVAFFLGGSDSDTYFLARLWRSDGTREGTFRVGAGMDYFGDAPGQYALTPKGIVFSGCIANRCGVILSDGTLAGTRQLTPDYPAEGFALSGQRLFYVTSQLEVIAYDLGTGKSETLPVQIAPNMHPLVVGGRVFLLAAPQGQAVWSSDGTAAGTHRIAAALGILDYWTGIVAYGNGVAFVGSNRPQTNQLWFSDGTETGSFPLGIPWSWESQPPLKPAALGDRVVLAASADSGPVRLWVGQGKKAPSPITAGCPGGCGTPVDQTFVRVGNRLVFVANDGLSGSEIWSTDGTPAGTRRLADICHGACSSGITNLRGALGLALFVARSSNQQGDELWASDGTPAGTRRISQFAAGTPFEIDVNGDVNLAGEISNGAFTFLAQDLQKRVQVWSTTGTLASTRQVALLDSNGGSSAPSDMSALATGVVFSACGGDRVRIFRSDGATAGTSVLADPDPPLPCGAVPNPPGLSTAASGAQVFFLRAETSSTALWRVGADGSGLTKLATFDGSQAGPLVPYSGGVALLTRLPAPDELWTSDGTLAGTHGVILPSNQNYFSGLHTALGRFFFSSQPSGPGELRLWVSDGTQDGTVEIGSVGLNSELVSLGGKAYFLSGTGLWSTDGTASGTGPVGEDANEFSNESGLVAMGGSLYFLTVDWNSAGRISRSDGTALGTTPIADLPRYFDPTQQTPVYKLIATTSRLFFVWIDSQHGKELWTSDGTAAGSRLVVDLDAGPDSSSPTELTPADDQLYFTATDGLHGAELFRTDGTAQGTQLVRDIAPGLIDASPEQLTVSGDKLFFSADDALHGREPWALSFSQPRICAASDTRLCLFGGRYAVEASWRDFTGGSGVGHTHSFTSDTGAFWFFDPNNIEVVLKVLDGTALNSHRWVFYGALSNVEYALTITDVLTGDAVRYVNPPGNLASVGDTVAFGSGGARAGVHRAEPAFTPAGIRGAVSSPSSCVPGGTRLCLQGGRFAVDASWKDFAGHTGSGQTVPVTADTGAFWFFASSNLELIVKVLDGTTLNGKYWVFFGALSNVDYTVTVTDTATGAQRIYHNPAGRQASVADTAAF
ncbi:MAG: ELWxxDGT repeat protein [Acidobacteriota bacterium]